MIRRERLDIWKHHLDRFWTWWTGELAGLLPPGLAARLRGRSRADIRLARDRVEIDIVSGAEGRTLVEERRIEDFDEAHWQELNGLILGKRTRLFLDPQRTHLLQLTLPAAAASGLSQAIALQLPLVSPLRPDHVAWAWYISGRNRSALTIKLLIARLTYIEDLSALFDTEGLASPPIYGQAGYRKLLLKPGYPVRLDDNGKRLRLAQWVGIGLLCSVPFTTLLGAWLLALSNESEARALREELAPRLRTERIAHHDLHVREVMRPLAKQHMLSAGLNAVVTALPDNSYIQSLTLDESGKLGFTLAGDIKTDDRKLVATALAKMDVREVGNAAADAPTVSFEMRAP